MTLGPHVAPADLRIMVDRERARDTALDADPEVAELRARYLERLDASDQARRELEDASFALGQATARVLREAGLT